MNNQEKQLNEKLAKWECKSRLIGKIECRHRCIVTTPFEPRGCLEMPLYEKWEELIDKEMIVSPFCKE